MADRPCNPGSDLKRLWRTLLPGTPFPQCGATDAAGATHHDDDACAAKRTAEMKKPAPIDRNA